ncbi:Ccc1 protein [Martiniozyma asiatica (nom. inval.)]|nr:Ccc1 protein [Martiniozyma asiatica]
MVLVAIKNVLFPSSSATVVSNSENSPLLPTTAASITGDIESGISTAKEMGFLSNIDPRTMSDLIIGLSDGLTVPFALTAGLSSLGDTKLVITGGLAELVSGAISMGLGGYLAAKSENEFYFSQVRREKQLYFNSPDSISDELFDILLDMGASETTADSFIKDLRKTPKQMLDFIVRFGRGLEEPAEGRVVTSALTIGSGYFVGGFVPLIPYFFCNTVGTGLIISVIVMLITLFLFGWFKSAISMGDDCDTKGRAWEGAQMVIIGSIAAGSAWGLVYAIGG